MVSRKIIINTLKLLRENISSKSMLMNFSGKSPFYILIATVLSARNRDDMTAIAVKNLFSRYKTPKAIANAPLSSLEFLIRKSGFYRIKAKRIKELSNKLIKNNFGIVPKDIDSLVSLPGVGRKTAGCVLVYAFNKPAIPVDVHVHRIANRLGWIKTLSPLDSEQELMKIVPENYWVFVNELFVLHGQNTCKPLRPLCNDCVIRKYCKKIIK